MSVIRKIRPFHSAHKTNLDKCVKKSLQNYPKQMKQKFVKRLEPVPQSGDATASVNGYFIS